MKVSLIITVIKEKAKKFRRLYYVYREIVKLRVNRRILLEDAVEKFEEEHPVVGSLADYKHALFRHSVSYNEYLKCYKFWQLCEKQRDEFVSEKEMRCIYRKIVQKRFNGYCANKVLLYNMFGKYVHRKWIYSGETSFDLFKEFVSSFDCIAKPRTGSLGKGVFVIHKDECHDCQQLYENCVENNIIVEERVRTCTEIEEFHPQSLNTIRMFTISNGNRCELVAAELRVGVGNSVVDNVSAGGIFAPINWDTGTIIMDGSDKSGNVYKSHPDTGKVFKGFVIPHWADVVRECKAMSTVIPEITFAGWDICVLQDGEIEMIEVNSYPNISGLQTAYHKGLKSRIRAIGKEVLGYDPIKLISVWSKSHIKYENVYGRY